MKPLFTEIELQSAKSNDKLPCKCYNCNKTFYLTKHTIKSKVLNPNSANLGKFCSTKCHNLSKITSESVNCYQCKKEFAKTLSQIKKSKNHFCSRSCSATYNNTHKTHGTRISKLEVWLQEQLKTLFPKLHIDYNKKDTINSELDIYIPSLKLAFELNGILHYKPIYGQEKLDQIQDNDHRKLQACVEKEISLCIIDTSSFGYFKETQAKKFLNIITEIINKHFK